jgi:hypothetical protein
VLAFYRSEEHAKEALDEARKNHFRRAAVVYRAEDGRLKSWHAGLAPRDRAAFGIALALVFALAAGTLGANLPALALLGLVGFLIAWFGPLWLGFGLQCAHPTGESREQGQIWRSGQFPVALERPQGVTF